MNFKLTKRGKKLLKFVRNQQNKNNHDTHSFKHAYRVLKNAFDITKFEENVNFDILEPAILLHDFERPLNKTQKDHAFLNSSFAKKILPQFGYTVSEIEKIRKCIAYHSDLRLKRRSKEARILFEADKLDTFGLEGFNRWVVIQKKEKIPKKEFLKLVLVKQLYLLTIINFKKLQTKRLFEKKKKILFELVKNEIGREEYKSIIKSWSNMTHFLKINNFIEKHLKLEDEK